MNLRRFALLIVSAAVVIGAAAYAFRAPLSMAVAQRVAASRLAADALNDLPDGLHVGLCGAGSPMPDDRRLGACTVVVAGRRLFVFDTGNGSSRNIGKLGFVHGRIEAIFLTHFHSDHIDGLGELLMQRWVSTGNAAPVPLYGPSGVEKVVAGFMQAYEQDRHYRVAHHGEQTVHAEGFGAVAKPFTVPPEGHVVLIKGGDLEISAFAVDHKPVHPAVGYRITYKGRSVVLSGDTTKSAAVQREATGVDLLVHEALSPKMVDLLGQGAAAAGRLNVKKLMADIIDYHTTPEQAAEIARDAKVRYLLLSHIAPPLPLPGMEKAFLGGAPDIFGGPIRVGADGDFISLPAGSQQIDVSRRF
ncbi:MAG TPA: MBL fold metallo-hydrolase [Burkholderiaceae bacterium]|nr:MBL fold metallo-hydrolase [Burkholderiaceae bacterium]